MTTCVRDGRPSAPNRLCTECAQVLSDAHSMIWPAYQEIDTALTATGSSERVSKGKVSGSPALVNLHALALTDPRTRWDGTSTSPRHIPTALRDWDRRLARWLGMSSHDGFVTAHMAELVKAPWVGQTFDEIEGLLRQLSRFSGGSAESTRKRRGPYQPRVCEGVQPLA